MPGEQTNMYLCPLIFFVLFNKKNSFLGAKSRSSISVKRVMEAAALPFIIFKWFQSLQSPQSTCRTQVMEFARGEAQHSASDAGWRYGRLLRVRGGILSKVCPPQAPSEWGGAVLSLGKRSWKASQMISTLPTSPGGRAGHKPCGKKSLHLGLPSLVFSKWTQSWEPFHDWQ